MKKKKEFNNLNPKIYCFMTVKVNIEKYTANPRYMDT